MYKQLIKERKFMRRSSTRATKTCCTILHNAMVDMYAKCGALLNVCGSLRSIEIGKKSMMKLPRVFGSVRVSFKSLWT